MVEQWTHKPLVVGSNPTLATHFKAACQAVSFFYRIIAADNRPRSDNFGYN